MERYGSIESVLRAEIVEHQQANDALQRALDVAMADNRSYINERHENMKTIETLQAQLRQVEGERDTARRRVDELESREIDVAVLQGDITDLTHANARLREALKKYGRHGTVEHVCAMMKHSDYHCDCGFAQHALADTEGQKGVKHE